MQPKRVFSHVDVRVCDRAAATAYYDKLFAALGMPGSAGAQWHTYSHDDDDPDEPWFGLTEDRDFVPGKSRIAFAAASKADVDRIAAVVCEIGSRAVEGPEYAYGPEYYAIFFEDPDGNRLEICYIGK